MSDLYPYLLLPAYKDYIWGGSRIPELYGRPLAKGVYAESWEVSDRPEGPSTIANGPLAGQTLGEAIARFGRDIIGSIAPGTNMPLLIKLIDAAEPLSVQVHPNDSNAHVTGGEPKTEMWYVLDASDDAVIYAGLKEGTTPEAFRKAIEDNSLEELLNSFKPRKGDIFFIPGGRVHAIGPGCLLLEVQQNSNTTYRVYDWGRAGSGGKPRQLHIEEAMKVIDFEDSSAPLQRASETGNTTTLLESEWFKLSRITLQNTFALPSDGSTFYSLFAEKGSFSIITPNETVECNFGQTCLIPAALRDCSLVSRDASVLCASL